MTQALTMIGYFIFSARNNLSILENSEHLQVDRTCKTVPQPFEQLYTVHAVKNNFTIPVVYVILPDKRAETYRRWFAQIKSMVPNLQMSAKTSDFELAAITAVKE